MINTATKTENTPLFITIYAFGMSFNGAFLSEGKSLGGSESAAYYIAKELVALGHTVTVFTSEQKCGTWDGVKYEWCGELSEAAPLGDRFAFAMKTPQDVVIIQRHPMAFHIPPNSKLNIWWLHDLALHRTAPRILSSLASTDHIFTVSEFHKKQVAKVYGINEDFIFATKNGVDYEQVNKAIAHKIDRQKKHLLFASRPERGLAELVDEGGIMEGLSDYHLHVCGYDNTTQEMASFYRYLYNRCDALPNVTDHGYLGKDQLYELMASCQAVVYPTMFEDTSNIIALEAAACGTPFIGILSGAVPETCSAGFAKLVKPKKGVVNRKAFRRTIKNVCENEDYWQQLSTFGLEHRQSWKDIAASWVVCFKELLFMKSNSPVQMIKYYEQLSDIVAMRHFANDDDIEKILPDFKKNYRFLIENDFEAHYKAYYEYEKARGVEYGPESLDGNPRFECIADIVKRTEAKTVLDYGCAHGHYTINLAKRMPDVAFVGVDIEHSNVNIARDWAKDLDLDVVFYCGTQEILTYADLFDTIIAAEVLEHVEDPAEVVNALIKHLTPGGTMIVSVPYGPWEAIGYKKNPGWRAHIHHLERQDLKELFSHFDDYKCLALPHSDRLGHYILTFTKPEDGRKCGKIDYNRKVRVQNPQQSSSVCMIAKDEADCIGKCLRDIAPYVDEVIVGVDNTTTDNTKEVVRSICADNNLSAVIFDIPSPIEIGFDEARNLTIEKATSDWILWIDADEILENVHFLPHYLRNNPYDGYMIQQHHYSAEPTELLQTDLPVRIFRNYKDLKFFGVVHEHPSQSDDMNKGVGKIFQIPNIHIMHIGYATESKRRQRFARNFPLMLRDREKHPERILGKFLMVRDLAHFIRYNKEQNHGRITGKAVEAAINAVELWNELLDYAESHSRYAVDALHYYSECVPIVTRGRGILYEGSVHGIQIKGVFANTAAIERLCAAIVKSATKIHDEKYF